MGDYIIIWFGVVGALLVLLYLGYLFRGFIAAFLSLIVALPLSVFLGFSMSANICAGSYEPFCGANIILLVPLILVFGYMTLLVLYRTFLFTLAAGAVTGPIIVFVATFMDQGHIYLDKVSGNGTIVSSIITTSITLAIIILLRKKSTEKLKNDFYETDIPEYEDY